MASARCRCGSRCRTEYSGCRGRFAEVKKLRHITVAEDASSKKKVALLFVAAGLTFVGEVQAQAPAPPPPYGAPIGLADAKEGGGGRRRRSGEGRLRAGRDRDRRPRGFLIYFERMDNTQLGSVEIAIEKARSAALFRRPTKVFEDAVAGGRNALLALHGAVPIEGGVPIISGGKIVGAIGASGARLHRTARRRRPAPTLSNRAGK